MAQFDTATRSGAVPLPTPSDEVPVGVQLAWRLRALIAGGRLLPGDQLPSVRVMAEWPDVNVNTVRAVYARLEDEGLIVTRHGRGTFVADGRRPRRSSSGSPPRRSSAPARRASTPASWRRRRMTVATARGRVRRGRRRRPRTSRDLAEPTSDSPGRPPHAPRADRPPRGRARLLQRELSAGRAPLRSRRGRPHRRRRRARGDPRRPARTPRARARGGRAARPQQRRRPSEARRDGRRPAARKWEKVSAAELGEPGCTTYSVAPAAGPLGALMRWWRVKVSAVPVSRPASSADGQIRCR